MAEADEYWVMQPSFRAGVMLLYSLPEPKGDQGWMDGVPFDPAPDVPVRVRIQPGYETEQPPALKLAPQIMSDALYRALIATGVDNLEVYEAVLESADGQVRLEGYKAYNVIGVVSAADLAKTEFSATNPSRKIDASIRSLVVDPTKARGLLLFRLAESVDTVIVHDRVKAAIEALKLDGVEFAHPRDLLS